jgi:site-specific recombinase XerD
MKGNSKAAQALNTYLDILKAKVYDIQKEIIHDGEEANFENIKNKLLGVEDRKRMLVPIFQDHNKKLEALVNDEFAPGTVIRYKTSLSHTIDFLKWKYNISDIDIKKIDHAFITEFEFYLRSVRKCNNNSAVKYIKNFGKIIRICIANGWIDKNPFVNYKSKVKEVERVFLVEEELQTMADKEFQIERLNQVKDIFLFSCFTGLAYIDVKKLTKNNINIGIDGERWIFTNRQKTDTKSNIPLLPMAEQIIAKYKEHPQCINEGKLLPVLSNQKMNGYLKEVADLCGIQKELTFHIARHTFATTVTLTNGVPIESVSKMLGHKNLKTTQHYAKILDRKVSDDMKLLRDKLSLKQQSAKLINDVG